MDDNSEVVASAAGDELFVQRRRLRDPLRLDHLTAGAEFQAVFEMQRRRISGEVLFLPEPASIAECQRRGFISRMTELSASSNIRITGTVEPGLYQGNTMTQVTFSSHVYSDDGSAARDMLGRRRAQLAARRVVGCGGRNKYSKRQHRAMHHKPVTVRRKRQLGKSPTPTLRQLTAPLKLDYDGHRLKIAEPRRISNLMRGNM